ncbi:MAG TPA: DEAD/DEAH box helicase [Candidatus Polarisedimenticolia bacterium]|nr:DEAD/DEAH box helicase [Candidatus Polarisedimenticolia bacterium]
MSGSDRKHRPLRQMRVVAIRPRGTPREAPPPMPERVAGSEPSAFPSQPVPFTDLDLPPAILEALGAMGYGQATAVQALAIPKAREGRDLIVQSRTGTGKTAAFGVPIVERIDRGLSRVQALVLCPTRELTVQVTDELARLGAPSGARVLSIYGGDPMPRQVEGLRRGAQVVVGTPGRLLDHLRQGTLSLESVRVLVLDEADQMLDMGFEKEMKQILERVPRERQTLLFSATIPSSIEAMAGRYQKNPERLMLSQDALYVTDVQHLFYIVSRMDKASALYKLIEYEDPASSMIFCNTRAETRTIYSYLAMRGLPVAMISSDLPQRKREQVMRRFRRKELKHLVATDVAARGIDIEDLSHVFIYSAPESSDQYIHRAGRTGRIGKTGKAISLVSGFDLMNFNRLVRANNLKAHECDLPSDEEVARKKVRRIVETLKEQAARLTPEERAEYEAMAKGILDETNHLAIVAYLLKTHFEQEAARGVLDEPSTAGEPAGTLTAADAGYAAAPPYGGRGAGREPMHGGHGAGHGQSHSGPAGEGGAPGSGRRRRRRRRRGGGGGGGAGGAGGRSAGG